MTIGENMKMARLRKWVTQKELSERSGVHVNSIGAYERGKSTPTVETACKLAKALGMTLDEYVNGSKLENREKMCYNKVHRNIDF